MHDVLAREQRLLSARVEEYLRTGVFVDDVNWKTKRHGMPQFMPMPSLRRMCRQIAKENKWPFISVELGWQQWWVSMPKITATEPVLAVASLVADRNWGKGVLKFNVPFPNTGADYDHPENMAIVEAIIGVTASIIKK